MLKPIINGGPVVACMAGGAYLGFSFFGPIGGAIGGIIGAIFGIVALRAVKNGKEKRTKRKAKED